MQVNSALSDKDALTLVGVAIRIEQRITTSCEINPIRTHVLRVQQVQIEYRANSRCLASPRLDERQQTDAVYNLPSLPSSRSVVSTKMSDFNEIAIDDHTHNHRDSGTGSANKLATVLLERTEGHSRQVTELPISIEQASHHDRAVVKRV